MSSSTNTDNQPADSPDGTLGKFASLAWGVGFAAADSVAGGAKAVAEGVAETLEHPSAEAEEHDGEVLLLRNVRQAALSLSVDDRRSPKASKVEPVSLLSETKDRHATLAFMALPEPERVAIWLTVAEDFPLGRTAAVLDLDAEEVEISLQDAATSFRTYYAESGGDADIADLESTVKAAVPASPPWMDEAIRDRARSGAEARGDSVDAESPWWLGSSHLTTWTGTALVICLVAVLFVMLVAAAVH